MKKIIFAFLLIFSCLGTHAQQGIWNDKGLIELTQPSRLFTNMFWRWTPKARRSSMTCMPL